MTHQLCAEGVHFDIDNRAILADVVLKTEPGEVLGLIWPNGAGKSTLLRLLAGFLKPTGGVVQLNNENIARLMPRELAKLIATVPQITSIEVHFPCLDVVLMGRSPHLGRFAIEGATDYAIALEAMMATETNHLTDRAITTLSGGERQLVCIARALAQQPRLLLLDEPVASLDIHHQLQVLELARNLAASGVTVLVALHDLNLAARFCQRLLLLAGGRVLASGPPEQVLTADNIRSAYRVYADVGRHPVTGAWSVTVMSRVGD